MFVVTESCSGKEFCGFMTCKQNDVKFVLNPYVILCG